MKRLIALTIVMAAALLSVAGAQAQDGGPAPTAVPVSDNDVNRVAKQLYCPVCPNTPLDVCETQACTDWRAQIKDQLGQGWTDQQVIDYFVIQYGERVLAEPKRSGFTSFVWILPLIALVIGGAIVAQVMRGWKTARRAPAPAAPAAAAATAPAGIPPEVLARLERELKDIA